MMGVGEASGPGGLYFDQPFLVPRERWVLLAIERKGKTLTFYQDGIADGLTASQVSGTTGGASGSAAGGTSEGAEPLTYTTSLRIGDNEEPLLVGVDLPGRIDDVRISRAALGAKLLASVTKYTYNTRNQLVTEQTDRIHKTYSCNKNGNTVGIVEHVNKNGQLVSTNQTEMTYDKFNRMTSWSKSAIDPDTGLPSPTPAQTETTTYRGAEWHRTSTTANGAKVSYLYDGDNVIADYGSTSTTAGAAQDRTAFYVTPGLDENLSLTTASGSTYYYSQDGLGSVRTLTTSNGSLTNTYDYTPFGAPIAQGKECEIPQRYTYTGRERATHAAAPMYYRFRHYAPSQGRFPHRDPDGYRSNPFGNLYAYVRAMVSGSTDPYGLRKVEDYIKRYADPSLFTPDPKTGCCPATLCEVIGRLIDDVADDVSDFDDFGDRFFGWGYRNEDGKSIANRIAEAYSKGTGAHHKATHRCNGFKLSVTANGIDNFRHFMGIMATGRIGYSVQLYNDHTEFSKAQDRYESLNMHQEYLAVAAQMLGRPIPPKSYPRQLKALLGRDEKTGEMRSLESEVSRARYHRNEKLAEINADVLAYRARWRMVKKLKRHAILWDFGDYAWKKHRHRAGAFWRRYFCIKQ